MEEKEWSEPELIVMGRNKLGDNEKKMKPKYQTPIVVNLGELARGFGACSAGSGDTDTCTAGGSAQVACTAGLAAIDGCTSGAFKG